MNINILNLFLMLMPVALRGAMHALITAIAVTWQRLLNSFRDWQTEARLEAATTCQVISIQHLLNERLLGTGLTGITIVDAPEGALHDFEVRIPVGLNLNIQQLGALVTRYKLYGKRFLVTGGLFTYNFVWADFVAEQAERTYNFVWGGDVAEQAERTYNFVWADFVAEQAESTYNFVWAGFVAEQYDRENHAHLSVTSGIADAWFDHIVASDVTIYFTYTRTADGVVENSSIIVPAGSSSSVLYIVDGYNGQITSISPTSDAQWDYLI